MLEKLEEFLPKPLIDAVCALYEKNDKAHRLDHVIPVMEHAEMIISRFDELESHRAEILTGAFMHDMMAWYNRDQHHLYGALHATQLLAQFDVWPEEDIRLTAMSVFEHRASFKGERTHIVSHAVAAADRGPVNFQSYLTRAIKFRVKKLDPSNLTLQQITRLTDEALEHLNDKFGPLGYAWERMPTYTNALYAQEIQDMQRLLGMRNTVDGYAKCHEVAKTILKKMGAAV